MQKTNNAIRKFVLASGFAITASAGVSWAAGTIDPLVGMTGSAETSLATSEVSGGSHGPGTHVQVSGAVSFTLCVIPEGPLLAWPDPVTPAGHCI